MFELNKQVFAVELERAKANLENMKAEAHMASLEVKRVKLLVDKNVISKSELDLAEARVKAAQARIQEAIADEEKAKIMLEFTTIRAPFDGVINRIPLKRGSFVSESQLLTSVSDLLEVYTYFDVSELENLHYVKTKEKSGSKYSDVTLQLADGSRYPYPGKIETIEGEIDKSTGSIAFRGRFPNPDHILKHGASGKVNITTTMHSVLLVPEKAVFEVQDKNYVIVLNKDSSVTMQSFTPTAKIAQSYAVKAGLNAGDRIVYEGTQNIKHGTKIQPRYLSQDTISSR